jgi:hypothetical protein
MFSDDIVSKLDAQWAGFDAWGDPHSTSVRKWDSSGGPWQTFVNGSLGGGSDEVYIPHQVPWTESVVNLGDLGGSMGTKNLEALQSDIQASQIDLSVLNSRNIIVLDPSAGGGSTFRFIVWEAGPNGPVMKLGPQVKRADIPSAKITGKLDTFKIAETDAASVFGFSGTSG